MSTNGRVYGISCMRELPPGEELGGVVEVGDADGAGLPLPVWRTKESDGGSDGFGEPGCVQVNL